MLREEITRWRGHRESFFCHVAWARDRGDTAQADTMTQELRRTDAKIKEWERQLKRLLTRSYSHTTPTNNGTLLLATAATAATTATTDDATLLPDDKLS